MLLAKVRITAPVMAGLLGAGELVLHEAAPASAAASPAAAAPANQTSEVSGNGASVWGIVLGAAGFILGAAAPGLVLAGRRTGTTAK